MKNFLVFLCAILAVFAIAKADDCNYKGHSLRVGESFTEPGTCILKTCVGPNRVTGKTCPDVVSLDSTKYVPEDYTKPYPDCCAYYKN